MKTFKVLVHESVAVTYKIKAKSEKEAEDIWYGDAVGEIKQIRKEPLEYLIVDVEEIK